MNPLRGKEINEASDAIVIFSRWESVFQTTYESKICASGGFTTDEMDFPSIYFNAVGTVAFSPMTISSIPTFSVLTIVMPFLAD